MRQIQTRRFLAVPEQNMFPDVLDNETNEWRTVEIKNYDLKY